MAKRLRKPKSSNKKSSRKVVDDGGVWSKVGWTVVKGKLKHPRGRPRKTTPIFAVVAEKIPFVALKSVKQKMLQYHQPITGVYFAHDSMGVARYGGRGQIFLRLDSHKKKYPRELVYFSFYVIKAKNHEREIETAILRAAGPQMVLNTRKVQAGIERGDVNDYEPGTVFFERQQTRGKRGKA